MRVTKEKEEEAKKGKMREENIKTKTTKNLIDILYKTSKSTNKGDGKWKSQNNTNFKFDEIEWGSLIFTGNCSEVYQGIYRRLNIAVALKCVSKDNTSEVKILQNEYKFLSTLDIPQLVKPYGLFFNNKMYVLVTELFAGGNLYDTLQQKGKLREVEVRQLLRSLLRMVLSLHQKGCVHRDIKLDNLALRSKHDFSSVSLIDFGYATSRDSVGEMCRICGSLGSVAPEVLMGKKYDEKVDVFGVGIVGYVLLAGLIPFASPNAIASLRWNCVADLDFSEMYWKDISATACDLVSWMCQRDPLLRCSAQQALKHPWLAEN